jgi:hypothetical protein
VKLKGRIARLKKPAEAKIAATLAHVRGVFSDRLDRILVGSAAACRAAGTSPAELLAEKVGVTVTQVLSLVQLVQLVLFPEDYLPDPEVEEVLRELSDMPEDRRHLHPRFENLRGDGVDTVEGMIARKRLTEAQLTAFCQALSEAG